MAEQKPSTEFPKLLLKRGAECWQIDDSRLDAPLDNGLWTDRIVERLIPAAAEHPNQSLYGATWVGPSVEFHWPGYSTWVAVAGPVALRRQFAQSITTVIPGGFIKSGIIQPMQTGWLDFFYIHGGYVWRPLDAVDWYRVDPREKTTRSSKPKRSRAKP